MVQTESKAEAGLGAGDLALSVPERMAIAGLQAERTYQGEAALWEAEALGLLGTPRQTELSPTFRCPLDCSGCPDGRSHHRGAPREVQMTENEWYSIIDRLAILGVQYFLLIGGTIDTHPLTPKLIRYILDKDGPVDVGWFTDGMPLLDWRTGQPKTIFTRLEEGGLLEMTTHISADYLDTSVLEGGRLPNPKQAYSGEVDASRKIKSAFGLALAKLLIERGAKRVIVNTAISAQNIDQVRAVYDYVAKLQQYAAEIKSPTVVLYTVSPWVWRPYVARGDLAEADTDTILQPHHRELLEQKSQHILGDTLRRLETNQPRVAANSSGFVRGLLDFAISQDVSYQRGMVEVLAVEPNGTVRMDPVFVSVRALAHARNPYGYRDRAVPNPFDQYNEGLSATFPNLVQTTRGNFQWH